MVPVLPLVAVAAALGIRRLALYVSESAWDGRVHLAVVIAILCALATEVGDFRFRRSEAAVRLAKVIGPHLAGRVVVADQAWRLGGRLFFPRTTTVLDAGSLAADELRTLLEHDNVAVYVRRVEARESVVDEGQLIANRFQRCGDEHGTGYVVYAKAGIRGVCRE